MEPMLSTGQVAEQLQVSPNTVKKLWREGRLRGTRISERKIRFRPEDVEQFLCQSRSRAVPTSYRAAEHRWCAEHSEELTRLAGEWVVVAPHGLVAHHPDPAEAVRQARLRGVEIPYVFYVEPPLSAVFETMGL